MKHEIMKNDKFLVVGRTILLAVEFGIIHREVLVKDKTIRLVLTNGDFLFLHMPDVERHDDHEYLIFPLISKMFGQIMSIDMTGERWDHTWKRDLSHEEVMEYFKLFDSDPSWIEPINRLF